MNLELGKTYTFNTRAPAILGASIVNAKLIGSIDYDSALAYDNIDLKYRTIYPLLPVGTPDKPTSSVYYRFLTQSGEKIVLADQWIDEATIELVDHINFKVTISQASISDMSRVRDAMLALGYTNFTIDQV